MPRSTGQRRRGASRSSSSVCVTISEAGAEKKGEFFAPRGDVFIGHSVRGAFASEGRFDLGRSDGWGANRDGYDTIEWAAAQSWSTGNVTMEGGSYSGFTQYLVAPTRPPHLETLFVREGILDFYRDWAFQGIRGRGRSEACRQNQRLMVGPWSHGPVGEAQFGELDFGPEGRYDLKAHQIMWYDHWLKGRDNGAMDGPPVHIFLMGDDRWIDLDAWPSDETTYRPIYFHGGAGKSAASLNNGGLSFDAPAENEQADSYVYDPDEPVPGLLIFEDQEPRDHSGVGGQAANNTVFHDCVRPSHVVLPVMPPADATNSTRS